MLSFLVVYPLVVGIIALVIPFWLLAIPLLPLLPILLPWLLIFLAIGALIKYLRKRSVK